MDFVDWCSQVLNTLLTALSEPESGGRSTLDEVRLFKRLFGDDAPFQKNGRRDAMRDALKELQKEGIVDGDGNHWKVTRKGRDLARDMKLLWAEICATQVDGEEEELLRFLNGSCQRTEDDGSYVWLQQVGTDDLIAAFGLVDRETAYNRFHRVAEGLRDLGLVEVRASPGFHLSLKPTYRGIAWESKRAMLRKCDVFISHATEDSAEALRVKKLLKDAFGEDIKVFVSSDYTSIGGGKLWLLEVLEGLKAAPVVLVILSDGSVDRRWVNFEAGIGVGAGGLVIPLVVSGFAKNDVGHPLSALQVRSLVEERDIAGMLSDVSERLRKGAGPVDVAAFVDQNNAGGGSKLEALVNHVPERNYDSYMQHRLTVGLVNNSSKTIKDFRVEVEVPSAFASTTPSAAEVEARRTSESRYYREESKDRSVKTLHPGDRVRDFLILSLNVPQGAAESGDANRKIVVKVFADDLMTQKIEKTVRDILEQPPSFG